MIISACLEHKQFVRRAKETTHTHTHTHIYTKLNFSTRAWRDFGAHTHLIKAVSSAPLSIPCGLGTFWFFSRFCIIAWSSWSSQGPTRGSFSSGFVFVECLDLWRDFFPSKVDIDERISVRQKTHLRLPLSFFWELLKSDSALCCWHWLHLSLFSSSPSSELKSELAKKKLSKFQKGGTLTNTFSRT